MTFARRNEFLWELRSRSLQLGQRTVVMGILNVTPDSFSDGGIFRDAGEAVDRALEMLSQGADLLDIGGESTRPGRREPLPASEEMDRVLPVIEGVLRNRPDAALSIDTWKAETAQAAVGAGVEIVNDVSGLLWDEAMATACAKLKCGVVLMHSRGRPEEWHTLPRLDPRHVVPLVKDELKHRLDAASQAGIALSRIALDPGLGFGKAYDSNYPLLARLGELHALGQPLLAGVSRKSFLGRSLAQLRGGVDAPPEDRGNATLAAVTASILSGADMVRVHDVHSAKEAAAVADAVLAAAYESEDC